MGWENSKKGVEHDIYSSKISQLQVKYGFFTVRLNALTKMCIAVSDEVSSTVS